MADIKRSSHEGKGQKVYSEKKFENRKMVDDHELEEILSGDNPELLVKKAKDIADASLSKENKNKPLSASQIRNIYGTVKKLQMNKFDKDSLSKLILLKPKLAYAVGRNKDVKGLKILQDTLERAIESVNKQENFPEKEKRFHNFCNFFEAILAYHKFIEETQKGKGGSER